MHGHGILKVPLLSFFGDAGFQQLLGDKNEIRFFRFVYSESDIGVKRKKLGNNPFLFYFRLKVEDCSFIASSY